jgi:hypothetical protein
MLGYSRHWKRLAAVSVVVGVCGYFSSLSHLGAQEESVPPSTKSAPATHKSAKVVTVADTRAGEKLEDFCIDAQGRILALLGPADPHELGVVVVISGEDDAAAEPNRGKAAQKKPPQFPSAVHIYDADGKLVEKWQVGFTGQAINTAPDGTIVIGGDGHVARFDSHGKKLHEAESPQMTYISKNPDEMRERAKEQLESDRLTYGDQVKQLEEQLKVLKEQKAKDKESTTPKKEEPSEEVQAEQVDELQLVQIIDAYKRHLKSLETQTVEQVLEQVLARARKTHSICADKNDVYVSCPAMAGYGFGVWRTDEKFGQAKEVIKSLSGCCGQMDVQCCNDELYVCENSRHRVIRFDRNGKEVGQFGKRDRSGEGEGFGGCCNPMNLCFNKDGNLYVSESNGVVKHFTPAGKYLGIVGIAAVQPGCKNSCVGVTADDKRLFYIDVYKSQIIVLARDETVAAQ